MSESSKCILPPFQFTIFHGYLLIVLITAILCGYLIYRFFKFYPNTASRIMSSIITLIFFFITNIIIFFFFAFFLEETEWPPSEKYHQIHAAIKNTCYQDPERRNCPRNLDEIINIEPEVFGPLLKNASVIYEYAPQANHFTLIIRDKSSLNSDYRVALFDSRLMQTGKSSPTYGFGVDFYDPEIMQCGDKYEIIDKPPFPGPWTNIN